MDKYPPEIFIILLYPMIQFLYLRPVQKPQNMFLQLAASLPRDDLYQSDLFPNGIADDSVKLVLDRASLIEYIMQIQLDLRHDLSSKKIVEKWG